MGNSTRSNAPCASLCTVRTSPVSARVAVPDPFETTAALASRFFPRILPVISWAEARQPQNSASPRMHNRTPRFLIRSPPSLDLDCVYGFSEERTNTPRPAAYPHIFSGDARSKSQRWRDYRGQEIRVNNGKEVSARSHLINASQG